MCVQTALSGRKIAAAFGGPRGGGHRLGIEGLGDKREGIAPDPASPCDAGDISPEMKGLL